MLEEALTLRGGRVGSGGGVYVRDSPFSFFICSARLVYIVLYSILIYSILIYSRLMYSMLIYGILVYSILVYVS